MLAQTRALQVRMSRMTQRERVLVAGLCLAALLYAPVATLDWKTQQEDRYIAAMTERSAARLALASARRASADPTSDAIIEDMNGWGFEASNVSVAKVLIEQRLMASATTAGLNNIRITTDNEIVADGPLQWLGAEVQADLLWAGTFSLLDQMTGWPEGFQVVGFRYDTTPVGSGLQVAPGTVRIAFAFPVWVENAEPAA